MSEIEIKKVAEKTLKTADNLGIATEKAKGIALKAKEKVSENVSDNSESPVNYAIDKVQDDAKNISEDAIYLFKKQGKKSVNETVKNTKKLEQSIEEVRARRKIKKDKSKINTPDKYTPKAQTETVKTDDIVSKNTPKNTQNKVRSASSIKTKEAVSVIKSKQPIINGTTSQTIYTSDKLRIRAEEHPLYEGETYNPRHHGVHYHVEYRNDPSLSWNNKNNVNKYYPDGYTPGSGTGFLPGEKYPGSN